MILQLLFWQKYQLVDDGWVVLKHIDIYTWISFEVYIFEYFLQNPYHTAINQFNTLFVNCKVFCRIKDVSGYLPNISYQDGIVLSLFYLVNLTWPLSLKTLQGYIRHALCNIFHYDNRLFHVYTVKSDWCG